MFRIDLRVGLNSVVIAALGPLGTCASSHGGHGSHGSGGHSHGGGGHLHSDGGHFHGGDSRGGGHFDGGGGFHGGGSHGGGGFFDGGSYSSSPNMSDGWSHHGLAVPGVASRIGLIMGAHRRAGPGLRCVRAHSPVPDSIAQVRRSGRSKTTGSVPGTLRVATLAPGLARIPLAAHLSSSSFGFESNRPSYTSGGHWNSSRSFSGAARHSILCRGGPAGLARTVRPRVDPILGPVFRRQLKLVGLIGAAQFVRLQPLLQRSPAA
jgi:hypothetical protein